MKDETGQKSGQKKGKSGQILFRGGVHHHYYTERSGYEITITIADLIGLFVFLFCLGMVGYVFVLAVLEAGRKVLAFWAWVRENRDALLIGLACFVLMGGVTFWYFVTFTKDEEDEQLV